MDMEIEALRPRHRFTVKEYYGMAEFGLLDRDARIELIDGDIIEMPPIGPPHATVVTRLSTALTQAVGDRAEVRTQLPVRLGETNEAQPDVCLVRPREVYYHRHPEADDVLLVIEVSDSSAAYDRIKKGRIYSRAWITEYWLVNIPDGMVEVYRSPGPEGYEEEQELRAGDTAVTQAFPDVTISIEDLLSSR
jgi:hypothetical protein